MKWKKLLCADRVRSYPPREGTKDLRTEFEKDYHRIIGSASFRRLQDKTQVFPLDKSDFVRTRLTHSLEVSSFARSLGQNISQVILKEIRDPEFLESYAADVCDILQCAGLIHDIGNPPFGHFGETVIRQWFLKHMEKIRFKEKSLTEWLIPQMREDLYHFEGNAQALRLVTKLHYLVNEYGMNLTRGLLGTIIKYPVSSLEINRKIGHIREKKMGYFYAERELFGEIQESLETKGARHPLTFALEAADDIAYLTADIEDAYKKGCITLGQLLYELKEFGKEEEEDSEYHAMVTGLEERYQKALTRGNSQPESYAIQNWVIRIQGWFLDVVTKNFAYHYEEIMDGSYDRDLFSGTAGAVMAKALGDIAYRYAFVSEPILRLEIGAETILSFLLEKFVDAILYYDTDVKMDPVQEKIVALISDNYKEIYRIYSRGKDEQERLYLRILLVTDFICGMTDSYAQSLYKECHGFMGNGK